MPRPAPTFADRARGALLGHAAGNTLGLPAQELGTAGAIAAAFPGGLRDVHRRDTPTSPWDDDVALAVILGEELLEPEVDLGRLAHRWARWADTDGRGLGEWTRTALRHIALHDSPPQETGGRATNGAVSRCLPVALATFDSPRNLVSGTFHTAWLTHPEPRAAWGAVAVNVAAACFLRDRPDFIPEVIEALRNNDAPAELLAAVRRVPLERREDLAVEGPGAADAVRCVEIALWFARHEPDLERGLVWLANAGGDTDTNAAVAGGLMGARDGVGAIPARWIAALPDPDHLRRLADHLARVDQLHAETARAGAP
ncbi:MAG TPA: ADP-ribosylglycohydrolase family protein [Gemmatimonadales bacterium]|nr:ADP-ribosylglycohydrolase family protein [Gemmatimonadales bacterium]